MRNHTAPILVLFFMATQCLSAQEPTTRKAVAPPSYPALGRISKISGTAVVSVNLGPDGKVVSINKEKSHANPQAVLANAEVYARRWEFSGPCATPIEITFEYRLVPRDTKKTMSEQESEYGTEFIPPRTIVITGVIMPKPEPQLGGL